ncbi:phospholipid-transporting ATPase ABCA3-like [Rhipicephalus microplus]|uniref:phospholipid-transporting ATPase ABCA3-like n=1 Tax=Rhipicephalus microplus TaxID=6941 RepID=UPI003F6CF585
MTRQTAAVLWRTLAIESIKRHYLLSLLEVLIVLMLALLFLSTKFVTQPTTEQGQLRQAVVSTGEDTAGTGYEFDDDQYPDNDDDDDNEDGDDDDKEHDNSGGDKNTTEEECGLYSPWGDEPENLFRAAFPGIKTINYNGEDQVAALCAYEGCVVCVHFRTLTNSTLEYALHLYEDENPGQKGLDIGFRHPREFFYDPEMDRQLWERAYKMQVALNSAFLRQRDKEDMVNITMRSFPVPDFPEDVLRYRYGFFWLASTTFLFPMYRIISRLCFENNSGLREYQLMMGLGNCFYWTGHFACACCFFVVHSAICVYGAVGYRHFDTGAPYLDRTDPSLLLVALLLHSVSQILLAMLAACVLNLVVAATLSIVLVSVALPYWVLESTGSLGTLAQFVFGDRVCMLLSSALPTVAAFNVLTILAIQNDFDGGAAWQKVHYVTLGIVPATVLEVWVVSILTMAVMVLLIGYCSNVLPWNTALPLHPLFFFKMSYWQPQQVQYRRRINPLEYYDPRFESAPSYVKSALDIADLSVAYGNNEALKSVSLQAFDGQATVLVGRNGAGKTTLMNVIAGLLTPDSGVARVYGYDVITRSNEARVFMAYCPQRDILFPDMTAWEHLLYFGTLRYMTPGSLKRAAQDVLSMTGLEAHTLVRDLKRRQTKRLSIAIAAISKPKLVVLDEPTAGLHTPDAREIWEILMRLRGSVSLFFSTHNMTEADVLADRVVCLSAGIVICNASPTHLKNVYGVGYKMTLSKSASVPFQRGEVLSVVKRCAPEAAYVRESPVVATIALHTVVTLGFDRMFLELEMRSHHLGISSIGLSASTLRDIYIK